MTHTRRSPITLSDGDLVSGIVVPYMEVATARNAVTDQLVQERVLPGAFSIAPDLKLNLQHLGTHPVAEMGGSLELVDGADALRMRARLTGPDADLGYQLLKRGHLRGLSAEYVDLDRVAVGGIEEVRSAQLVGIGLVDSPAFVSATVQMRVGQMIEALIPFNSSLRCKCQGQGCDTVEFNDKSFDDLMSGAQGETLAILGDYAKPLASQSRGSLKLEKRPDGIVARFVLPDSDYGRELIAQAAVGDIIGRPVIDPERSTFTEQGTTRKFSNVWVKAIGFGVTDAEGGWPLVGVGAAATVARLASQRRAFHVNRRGAPWL